MKAAARGARQARGDLPLAFLARHERPPALVMQAICSVQSVKRDGVYRDKLAETAIGVLLLIT